MNYAAILLIVLANTTLGMLWYSPTLFETMWMEGLGVKKNSNKKEKILKPLILSGCSSLIMGFSLNYLAILIHSNNSTDYIQLAFWIWLGFIATSSLNSVLWEKQNYNVYIINAGFWLVALIIDAGIIGLV